MNPQQIETAARTVAHMATYFEELKRKARLLAETGVASERGYFTPSEDEAVRQLLVSYWKARCALLELVIAFRDDPTLQDELRPEAFLTAFAGAVLLVDGGWFLRELFHHRPLVRGKLNEPEPHFGIPGQAYDAVQKSLTSPWNAWHLHHARHYWREQSALLAELGRQPLFAPAWNVIERLGGRVDVSLGKVAKYRVRFRASEAVRRMRRDMLGRAMYGLQRFVSSLTAGVYTRRGHVPRLPDPVAAELRALLQPGDVLITRKEHALTNYFLPGFWPHAALYLGDAAGLVAMGIQDHENVRPRWARLLTPAEDEPRKVLEAMADGVRIRSLDSPFGADALAVLRPRLPPPQVAQALARGLFHEGKEYDFDFDFSRSDRLVCTEVVYRSFEGIGGISFALKRRAGRLTLAAEDLLEMARLGLTFDSVAAFVPGRSDGLAVGPAAQAVLRGDPPSSGAPFTSVPFTEDAG